MAHAGGRPPLYTDVNEVERLIEDYFGKCDVRTVEVFDKKRGEVVTVNDPEPYTMSGLAYFLNMDRDSLLNYSKKAEFFGTIKRARDKVHMDVERRLMDGAGAGAIFSLKNNFDWKDRTEQDITSKGEQITNPVSKDQIDTFLESVKDATKQK